MYTKTIIKLANKFEKKYTLISIATTKSEKIKQDISNGLSDFVSQLYDDNVSVTLILGREKGIGTWFKGSKIEIKKQVWSENTTGELKAKYRNGLQQILNYVNQPGMNYEGGPWTFTLP